MVVDVRNIKQIMKNLLFNNRGSVSIYAIIIILPVFLMNALFIDTMRILVAERQIESSLDAALRSTMAKFDTKLANLGLFAYSGDEGAANGDFQSYLQKATTDSSLSGYNNIAVPNIDMGESSISFDFERNLVDLDVFRSQVIETMKYQAPVQIGTDIFDMFKLNEMSSGDVDNMQDLVDNYEEILELMKKRNNKIDSGKEKIDKFIEEVKALQTKITGKRVTDVKDKIPKNLKTFHELKAYHSRYITLKEMEERDDDEEEEFQNYKASIDSKDLLTAIGVKLYYDDVPLHLIGNNGTLSNPEDSTAKAYNDEIKGMVGTEEEFDDLKSLVIEDSFFEILLNNTDEVYDKLILEENNLDNPNDLSQLSLLELIHYFYNSLLLDNEDLLGVILQAIDDKFTDFENEHFKKIKSEFDKYELIKKELDNADVDAEEEKAETGLSDIFEMLNELKNLSDDQATYNKLEEYVLQYDGAFAGEEEADNSGVFAFIQDAFDRFKYFIEFVEGFPESIRNELYINEYVLANFATKEPYAFTSSDFYKYDTKKGQYIAYGHHVSGMNYFHFLLDITCILLIVNLLDELKRGGFAGPLGFYKAIATAMVMTLTELTSFLDDGKLEWNPFKMFAPSKRFTFTGTMFLRIFLAVKSIDPTYNDGKIRRIQAAASHETNRNLLESPSYIEGHVSGDIKLWFIPQLAEVLPGKVEGNRYKIEKHKVYSY